MAKQRWNPETQQYEEDAGMQERSEKLARGVTGESGKLNPDDWVWDPVQRKNIKKPTGVFNKLKDIFGGSK